MSKILHQSSTIYLSYLTLRASVLLLFCKLGFEFYISNLWLWNLLCIVDVAIEIVFFIATLKTAHTAGKLANITIWLFPLVAALTMFTISTTNNIFFAIIAYMSTLFCAIIFFILVFAPHKKHIKFFAIVKGILFAILSLVLSVTLLISYFLLMMSTSFHPIIIQEVDSPNKAYTAIVVNSDQGALGSDICVQVRHNFSKINLGFGYYMKTDSVYTLSPYEAGKNMKIEWADENILFINGKKYNFKK